MCRVVWTSGLGRACLVVLMCLAMGSECWAESSARPFWTEQAMFRFGEDLFFVGVASCAGKLEDGRLQAFEDGLREVRAYAQGRDTSRLLVDTQMLYEEPGSSKCPTNTVSVWRLLRVRAASLDSLPRRFVPRRADDDEAVQARQDSPPAPPVQATPPVAKDLTPQMGMTQQDILDRFGNPPVRRKQGKTEIWEYPSVGLTVTIGTQETLLSWVTTGTRERAHEQSLSPALSSVPPALAPKVEPVPPPPPSLPLDKVAQGRMLFNGNAACSRCHGVDGDSASPDLKNWFSLRYRTDLDRARLLKGGVLGGHPASSPRLTDAEFDAIIGYLNELIR